MRTREALLVSSLSNSTFSGSAMYLKILPGNKTLRTSSVPLLWNNDITDPSRRADANFAKSLARPGGVYPGLQTWADGIDQGCNTFMTNAGVGANGNTPGQYAAQQSGAPSSSGLAYHSVLYDAPSDLGFGSGNGLPGFPVYTSGGPPSGIYLPFNTGYGNTPTAIFAGGIIGNNDWSGPNENPFPSGSAPVNSGGNPPNPGNYTGPTPWAYNAVNTVLRTNALSLGIAPGGVSVNMSTGTAVSVATGGRRT